MEENKSLHDVTRGRACVEGGFQNKSPASKPQNKQKGQQLQDLGGLSGSKVSESQTRGRQSVARRGL